jgi:hypothetical protein
MSPINSCRPNPFAAMDWNPHLDLLRSAHHTRMRVKKTSLE